MSHRNTKLPWRLGKQGWEAGVPWENRRSAAGAGSPELLSCNRRERLAPMSGEARWVMEGPNVLYVDTVLRTHLFLQAAYHRRPHAASRMQDLAQCCVAIIQLQTQPTLDKQVQDLGRGLVLSFKALATITYSYHFCLLGIPTLFDITEASSGGSITVSPNRSWQSWSPFLVIGTE